MYVKEGARDRLGNPIHKRVISQCLVYSTATPCGKVVGGVVYLVSLC